MVSALSFVNICQHEILNTLLATPALPFAWAKIDIGSTEGTPQFFALVAVGRKIEQCSDFALGIIAADATVCDLVEQLVEAIVQVLRHVMTS